MALHLELRGLAEYFVGAEQPKVDAAKVLAVDVGDLKIIAAGSESCRRVAEEVPRF